MGIVGSGILELDPYMELKVRTSWPLVLFALWFVSHRTWNDCRWGWIFHRQRGAALGSLLRQPLTCIWSTDWTKHWAQATSTLSDHYLNGDAQHSPSFVLLLFKIMFPVDVDVDVVVVVALGLHTPCFSSATRGSRGCKECVFISHLCLYLAPMLPGVSAPL